MKGKRTGMAAKSRPGDGCDFSSWRCPRRGAGSSRPRHRLARPAPGHVPPDPPVARGWPLARPGSGMRGSLRAAGRTSTIRRTSPRASDR